MTRLVFALVVALELGLHQWPRKLCGDSTIPNALIGDEDPDLSGGTLLEFH
jgi:hypothetical protein